MNVFGTHGPRYWAGLAVASIFEFFLLFKKKPTQQDQKDDAAK